MSYYSSFSMIYSLIFSIILVSFWAIPVAQLILIAVLNGVYLALACFRPYNQRFLNVINIANHVMVFVSSLLLLTTLGASSYADYPVYASVACGFVLVLVFVSNGFTFGVLFLRLTVPFVVGIKRGFKFEKIIKFSSEDVEVEVPEIVLPNQMHAGRIQYDEPRNHDIKEFDATAMSVVKSNNGMVEEAKEEHKQIKTDIPRNILYNDDAL